MSLLFFAGFTGRAAERYTTEPAFGGVTFTQPTQVVFAPGETNRAFVLERGGHVAVIADLSSPSRTVFLDIADRLGASGVDHGLLSLAFHPQFATNGFFYLWFSTFSNGVRCNRLARFKVSSDDRNRADPASEFPLITQPVGPGGHDGGTLLFGPDSYLYLSIGDGFNTTEAAESHQRIDRGFFGCVLRLDVDQRAGNLLPNAHPSVHAGAYRVPADNPFVGATHFNGSAVEPTAVRTEFWAVGLRNPFRLSFDEVTGQLWCGDVGLDRKEEIDLISRGGNYGWNFREGSMVGPATAAPPAGFTGIDPVWEYSHPAGFSVTGGIVYHGSRFPNLAGCYLFSDFVTGRIWSLQDDGTRPLPESRVRQIATETGIVGFTLDPRNGDILLADLDSNVIKRLAAAPDPANRLVNLSVRTRTAPAEKTLIMGFVIAGAGTKDVLARGLGPTLARFNVAGALPDPRLELFDGRGVSFDSNDDWGGGTALENTFSRLGAIPLGSDTKDAALFLHLGVGVYSAHLTGKNASSGIALAELYDASSNDAARFVNASVRSDVGTGDDVLVLGFVIDGPGSRTLLIRAVGPTLGAKGVTGALADPRLQLLQGSNVIAINDDWGVSPELKTAFDRVGAFGFDAPQSKDAALLVTLEAGVYAMQVSGAANNPGVVLAEIYEVP